MAKLNIGVGGIPLSTKKTSTPEGILRVKELGLDLMEMEFVYGVKMSASNALEVNEIRQETGVELTVHGPYYVNLASLENRKLYGSIKYISDSVYIGGLAGAKSVTFHPAFYQGLPADEIYEKVKKAIGKIYETFDQKRFADHPVRSGQVVIAPELTGKPSQFGDLEELIRLAGDFKDLNLKFCIDFAHKFARSNGKFNSYEEFTAILSSVESTLGRDFLDDLHMHVSAINYGEKGERNHLTFLQSYDEYKAEGIDIPELQPHFAALKEKGKTTESAFDWRGLLQAIKNKNVGGYLVCESPILELDALLLKQYYQKL